MPAFDRRRPRREEAPINFHFFRIARRGRRRMRDGAYPLAWR